MRLVAMGLCVEHVRNVDHPLSSDDALKGKACYRPERPSSSHMLDETCRAPRSAWVKKRPVIGTNNSASRIAETHRLFEHRVKYRREVAGRGIDGLQYFGSPGLLLQCLTRLGQEPRVFHCDHRLRGEILDEPNFLVRERSHFLAVNIEGSKQGSVLAQRHGEQRSCAAEVDIRATYRIAGTI